MAMVKVEEGGNDGKGEWVHEMITTFFETEWKLHGQEASRKFFSCDKKKLIVVGKMTFFFFSLFTMCLG